MQKKAAYSLVVRKGMRFEIPLNGTAWTYIGASGAAEGILYQNRKYEASKVFFAFNPVIVGEYLLEFNRQDVLLDDIETIFVRVIVDPEEGGAAMDSSGAASAVAASPGTATTVAAGATSSAPAGANGNASAESAKATGSSKAAAPAQTAGGSSGSTPQNATASSSGQLGSAQNPASPGDDLTAMDGPALLKKTQKDLDSGKTDTAQAALDSYASRFPLGDEYLYWAARFYESPGPQRDILKARGLYVQLMQDFPESPRYDAADARIEYIDRHYLDLR